MAWAEQDPRTGRWRGRYRAKRGGPTLDLPETYGPSEEAACRRDAAVAEDKARNNRTYRRNAGKVLYETWVEEEWWDKRGVEANTEGQDQIRMAKHIIPRWGTAPLEDIEQDRDAVQAWVDGLAKSDLAAATVHKIFYLFSASMKAAMIAKRIGSTPCVSIKLPPIPPSDERYLEREEYAAIREQLPTQRDKLLADILVYTGARWSEAVAIHRRRISKTRKVLSIHDAYEAATDSITYPKGKKKRGVPLIDDLLAELVDWMDHNPARCTMPHKKGSKCEHDLLLSNDDGTVLDYSHWEKYVWRPAVKAAGVGHTRIHDLRHTFASWLIQAGRTLEEIGALLGHATFATTQRYAHLARAHWEAARTALTGGSTPAKGMSEGALRAAIERLAAEQSGRWGDALAALNGAPDEGAAPNLPRTDHQTDGAKIIQLGRRRRSQG